MKKVLYVINNSLLFMAVSIYFGTGWSTAIFQFPVMPMLTVQNYYLHFIPQIDAATNFFTFLVTLMGITGVVMTIGEWRTRFRWIPILVLLAVVGATSLTWFVVFPVNDVLRNGVSSQAELMDVVGRWKQLTLIRVAIWSFEWLLMMWYFAAIAVRKGEPR
ncbi:MAG: hypothetical protein ACRD3G_03595 [Vicinamibacterales bacterium]